MSTYEEHRLLSYLDRPRYFLYWTLDEVGCVLTVLAIGSIYGFFIKGLLIGLLFSFGLRVFKNRIGYRRIRHFFYWHLPHPSARLKKVPPSCKREILG